MRFIFVSPLFRVGWNMKPGMLSKNAEKSIWLSSWKPMGMKMMNLWIFVVEWITVYENIFTFNLLFSSLFSSFQWVAYCYLFFINYDIVIILIIMEAKSFVWLDGSDVIFLSFIISCSNELKKMYSKLREISRLLNDRRSQENKSRSGMLINHSTSLILR